LENKLLDGNALTIPQAVVITDGALRTADSVTNGTLKRLIAVEIVETETGFGQGFAGP
jgi:hypothetical protein